MSDYDEKEFYELRVAVNYTVEAMERLYSCLRRQDIGLAMNVVSWLTTQLEQALSCLKDKEEGNQLLSFFMQVQDAIVRKDWALAADYLEIGMQPILLQVLEEGFQAYPDPYFCEHCYSFRLKTVIWTDAYKHYAKKTKADFNRSQLIDNGYRVEYTSSGEVTVARTGKRHDFETVYFHSNVSPCSNSRELAEGWLDENADRYVVFGLGMGFHVRELMLVDEGVPIDVYEPDCNMIETSCAFVGPIGIYADSHVRIYHDPDCSEFIKAALGEHVKVCLFEPAIHCLPEGNLKASFQKMFLEEDNFNRWKIQMSRNFRINRKHVSHRSAQLKPKFQGKTIYLVAGGPSLDKNILDIKKAAEQGIVLAVARSLKYLLAHDIIPDYCILTDPKPPVYEQIRGIETCQVPMILLSTAWREVSVCYKGEKYLIFQHGFEKAEQEAQVHKDILLETGGSVVTTAIELCIRMECQKIVFVGLDLAFTENRTHFGEHGGRISEDYARVVEDIYGNLIPTSENLNSYRRWIENRIARENSDKIEFIDATEGGAKIAGTKMMTLQEAINEGTSVEGKM